ncbi:MAG: VOC family protein, partial [Planctomycetota bacterium]
GGMLMHAEIKIGDSVVMLHDAMPQAPSQSPKTLGGPSCVLALYTADCDAAIQQAVDAGAELKMPATDMFWGDRYGMISDPYGHVWSIATHKEDLTPEQLQERAEQFFSSGAASEGCEG